LDLATGIQSTLDFNKAFLMAASLDGDKIAFLAVYNNENQARGLRYSVSEKRFIRVFTGEKWTTGLASVRMGNYWRTWAAA